MKKDIKKKTECFIYYPLGFPISGVFCFFVPMEKVSNLLILFIIQISSIVTKILNIKNSDCQQQSHDEFECVLLFDRLKAVWK